MFAWESQHSFNRYDRYGEVGTVDTLFGRNFAVLIVERFFGGLPAETSFWATLRIHIILWIWIQLNIIIYICPFTGVFIQLGGLNMWESDDDGDVFLQFPTVIQKCLLINIHSY